MRSRSVIILSRSMLMRKGLRSVLLEYHSCHIAAEISDVRELPPLVTESGPDLLFADASILGREEYERLISSDCPGLARVTVVALKESEQGASMPHITAAISAEDDEEAVRTVLDRLMFDDDETSAREDQLSERELNVLREIVLGLTNREAGDKLFISTHTVITHRKNITRKLGIRTLSGLTVYAIINGIVGMEEIRTAE